MEPTAAQRQIESTLEIIKTRDAAYRELADRFASLFDQKEQVRTELIAATPHLPGIDGDSMKGGVPILAETDLTPWADAFRQSADSLLPVLADVLQLKPEAYQKLQFHLDDTENLLGLVNAQINNNWKYFKSIANQLGLTPAQALPYISQAVSNPVLSAIASQLGESLSSLAWEHRHCPLCGSSPSISQLSPKEAQDSEHLVGGGGRKYLHCSLCGHDWRYKRNACAVCGNDDNESRELLYLDGVQHERIEMCHSCGKYMLNVDMRGYTSLPHLDTIQMGLIHLDIIARERNLSPVAPTLWNTIN